MTGAFRQYDPAVAYHVEYRHTSAIWPLCQHGYVSGGCDACQSVGVEELVAQAPASEGEVR